MFLNDLVFGDLLSTSQLNSCAIAGQSLNTSSRYLIWQAEVGQKTVVATSAVAYAFAFQSWPGSRAKKKG